MAPKDEQSNTMWNLSTDWTEYMKYRPAYPQALFDIMYEHHLHQGNGSWARAADEGAGVGLVGQELLKKFEHVAITDASESHITKAKNHIARRSQAASRASFLVTKAEDLAGIEAASLDLLVNACSMHWCEPVSTIKRAAEKLRSGGTFVVIEYSTVPYLVDPADKELNDFLLEVVIPKFQAEFLESPEPRFEAAGKALRSRLDYINFDNADWRPGVKRTHWAPEKPFTSSLVEKLPENISEHDIVKRIEKSIMMVEMDFEWFRAFLWNIYPSGERMAAIKNELDCAEKMFAGKARLAEFPLSVVLATRR